MASISWTASDFFAAAGLRFQAPGEPPSPARQVAIWMSQSPADGRALGVDAARRTRVRLAPRCYPDDRDVLLQLTRRGASQGRMAIAGDRHCMACVFEDLSVLAYREERRRHSYSHSPRFHVLLMPLKRTEPGDAAAGLATLLASSGDPLHLRRRGPPAPAEFGPLLRAIARTSGDPRLCEGAALVVLCRVDDPREPQPSRAFLRGRDGAEHPPSERDARLIGAVLERLDPTGHRWMPCGPWHNRRSCQAARPRRIGALGLRGYLGADGVRSARHALLDWIERTGADPSLERVV